MAKYTEIEALKIINERISTTQRFWRTYHDDFDEIYQAYRFYSEITPEMERGEKSNIFVPYAFAQVETKLPRVIQAILAFDPFFKVTGVGEEDAERADFVKNLLQHQIKSEINTFWALLQWFKECMMYGNSFMFIPWIKLEKKLKKKIPRYIGREIIGYDYERKPVIKKDCPGLQPLDIFDCFPAPFGNIIEIMPYFLVRSEPTAQYLKEMSDKGVFDKKVVAKLLRKSRGTGQLDETRKDRMDVSGLSPVYGEDPQAPRYVMWTSWEDDWVIRMIDNELVQNDETPFSEEEKPIVMAIDTPIPHELFAFGQIAPILKLNYYANDILNLNLDNIFQLINPGMTVLRGANFNLANFINNPSGIHPVDTPNALESIKRGDASIQAQTHIGLIERFLNLATGSGDVIRGLQASKGQQTAREVMSLIEQANYRFDLSVRLLKEFSLRRMLKMLLWRNQDFMPWEKAIRIHGEEDVEYPIITPDDILGNFDFEIKMSPVQGNKIAWAQSLVQFLDILNADQGQHPELVREIGQALGVDASEQYIQNPALEGAQIIAQAINEGLMKNAKQAFTVLGHVFNLLAPPGSENAKRIGARMKTRPEGVRTEAGEAGL